LKIFQKTVKKIQFSL